MKNMIGLMAVIAVMMIASCGSDDSKTAEGASDCSGNFPNEHDSICWSDKAANTMTWEEAITYCTDLGGRLPTIDELRTIIINCPGSMTGGACQVSDPDHLASSDWSADSCYCDGSAESYSALGDGKNTYLWSSSSRADNTTYAWHVNFYNGRVFHPNKTLPNYVRCVR